MLPAFWALFLLIALALTPCKCYFPLFYRNWDEVEREMKELELSVNPERRTQKSPSRFDDDLYGYRTSTRWPPIDWHHMTPSTELSDSFLDTRWDTLRNRQERIRNELTEHLKNINFKDLPPPKLPPLHIYERSYLHGLVTIGCGIGIVFLLIIIVLSARWKKNIRPGTVVVVPPAAVQLNQQLPMRQPGQGGAVPPNIEMQLPYSKIYNQEPPPYPTDTEPLVPNKGCVEIGFKNECVDMSTGPNPGNIQMESISDNGRKNLNLGLNNETGQGTRLSGDGGSVKYVDEKSRHN